MPSQNKTDVQRTLIKDVYSSCLLTLNGGELRLGSGGIDNPSGPVTINLGGGTLSASDNWSSSLPMTLTGAVGDAKVDTSGNTIALSGTLSGPGGLEKMGAGTLTLSANNTYGGNTDIGAGTLELSHASANNIPNSPVVTVGTGATLDVTGLSGGTFGLSAGQVLKGTGTVAGTIGGQGLVSPGASPGILTATAVDPAGGNDHEFEFRQEDPDYGDPANSFNDVLRLTDSSDPFTADMTAANEVDIYLNVSGLAVGDTFRGGFYTDRGSDFLQEIQDATFNVFVAGAGGSVDFEGVDYFPLDEYLPVSALHISTVYDPANFGGGLVDGYVMQLSAVPEPASLVLAAMGLVLLVAFGRRLRRKGKAAA